MTNLERLNMYQTLVKLQDIQIKYLKKELLVYKKKYKKVSEKYYYENRKSRGKN